MSGQAYGWRDLYTFCFAYVAFVFFMFQAIVGDFIAALLEDSLVYISVGFMCSR